MTTPDLFFPDARPATASTRTDISQDLKKAGRPGGGSRDDFASLMDRALDTDSVEQPDGPEARDIKVISNESSRGRALQAQKSGQKASPSSSEDLGGCDAGFSADAVCSNNAKTSHRVGKARTAAEASDEAADDSEEGKSLPKAASPQEPGSDALAPNIIILPPSSVVIPLPGALTVEGAEAVTDSTESVKSPVEFEGMAVRQLTTPETSEGRIISFAAGPAAGDASAADEASEVGIELAPLKMLPVEEDEPDNIKVVDFRQPAEAKIIPFPGPSNAELEARNAESDVTADSTVPGTQLPRGEGEEIAQQAGSGGLTGGPGDFPQSVRKAIVHAGLERVRAKAAASAEATGISAARQDGRMDSMKNSEQGNAFAGRGQLGGAEEFPPAAHESSQSDVKAEVKAVDFAPRVAAMDWPLGRPVGSFDRPSLVPPATVPLTPEQSATVDRVSSLILRETSLVRQYSSDSMAVVLRPDDGTELYVHFARRNGQIEATVRCDRGDAHQLGALWPQLQESLAQQRVRLAPLQEGPSANSNFNLSTGFGSGQGSGSQRQLPSDRQSMDERSAPASSSPDVSHVRGRGGSRRRLTTSRPGWETWA